MKFGSMISYFSVYYGLLALCLSQEIHCTHAISSSSTFVQSKFLNPLGRTSSSASKFLTLRGGKNEKKKTKKKGPVATDVPEDDTIDSQFDEDSTMQELDEDSNSSNQLLSSVGEMWTKTPPVTQIYIAGSVLLSLMVFTLNKNVWPEYLNLDWKKVFTRVELWRPFTAFLFFGPLGMNYLLTIHFVWTYMSQLEKLNFKAPEDFFVLITFGAVTLLPLYSLLGLSTKFLGHNLSTYLVYIWARLFEGTDVNVMDLFLLRAEVLPWFFCAQTFILEGEVPFADLLGIVVGHLYHYLKKRNLLTAPPAVKSFFSTDAMKLKYAKFRDDFELI